MENRCANYDKQFKCCRILSDWSEAMPVLQPCVERPCKYFKPYTNYDRIKSMSVEEMTDILRDIHTQGYVDCLHDEGNVSKYEIEKWLLQEVGEDE